jgi:hypothetical protein
MPAATEREVFRPSGKFSPLGLAWALPVLLVAALALAFGLAWLEYTPFSLLILVPALAGMVLGWIGLRILRAAHCRSRTLGWLIGLAFGALMYLGSFQATVIIENGPMAIPHLEVWPAAIVFKVNNWVIGRPGAQQQGQPVPVINWILFAAELGIASALSGYAMAEVASRGYCERCEKWMSTKTVDLAANEAAKVAHAIGANSFPELEPLRSRTANAQEYSQLEVEGCLHGGSGDDANFFLTAREGVYDKDRKKVELHDVVKQLQLTPDELLMLAEKCPALM